jgi:NitT/TauT family transport system substrate-binding protein
VPGSSSHLVVATALQRAGLSAQDVSYVGVGTGAGALEALRSGQIDAICNVEPVISLLEHRGEVKIIADTRTLSGTRAVFGGLLPSTCLYASESFVRENPLTCQALTRSIVRALKWLRTASPQDMLQAVPESYFLGDRGLYLLAFSKVRESYSLDGLLDQIDSQTVLQALAQFNPALREQNIDLRRTYTNDFASEAKARYLA